SAIHSEFSSSVHCLYLFHIDLNLKKNLRNKLNSDEFWEFCKNFFKCRNTMVEDLFESHWEALKLKYTSASSYIKHQLDPTKTKWAVCNINNQFTTDANSTQHVESLNHKIHSCVGSNLSFLELVKEIQDVLDKESNYIRIEEYESEIPKVGLATVPKTYFNSIETIISQYLMPTMVFKEQVNMNYDKEMRENNYELMKVHLVNIVEKVGYEQIVEIWKLYKDNIIKENPNKVWEQSPILLYIANIQNQDTINNFRYLKDILNSDVYTPVLQKFNSTHQKYGRVQGIMQKVPDLVIFTNSYDELI
ncbi:10298_t:CDS:2, partial [Dentiscutata erythropus]